jgi:hypothetical protein
MTPNHTVPSRATKTRCTWFPGRPLALSMNRSGRRRERSRTPVPGGYMASPSVVASHSLSSAPRVTICWLPHPRTTFGDMRH